MKNVILVFILLFFFISGVRAQQEKTYQTRKDIRYRTEEKGDTELFRECVLDVYYPVDGENLKTVIWFHGGGLTGGQRDLPQELCNQGIIIVPVDYRLSPGVSCPAYIEDAAAAIAWCFKHIGEFGGNPDLIYVAGHSAGGYLALITAMDKKYLGRYDINADRIAGLIPLSPQVITHFTIRKERGLKDTQPVIDEYAPLYHVRKDAPGILLLTGDREQEMLGRYEENAYFWRMMKLTGHPDVTLHELQGFDHGGMARPAYPLLLKFVKRESPLSDSRRSLKRGPGEK